MIPKELAKKIRYIQIYTSKAVNDMLAGEYESVFKGRGMEFDEVREYQPGDEIRSIDWNVTARTGTPYVKRYVEERELTVMFLVDLSASGSFGSVTATKNEIAAELCALLAFSAVKNNDKVGLIVFTGEIELFIPPAKGAAHVLRIIREILSFKPTGKGTNISGALDYAARVMRKRSTMFLLSDFLDKDYEKQMRILSRRHDLISVSVSDPREKELPPKGLIQLQDAETGKTVILDCASNKTRAKFAALEKERQEKLREAMRSIGVDQIEIETGRDYIRDLVRFFRGRERRMSTA